MKKSFGAALVVVIVIVIAGCGDSSSSSSGSDGSSVSAADRNAFVASATSSGDLKLSKADATCLADKVLPNTSSADAKLLIAKNSDFAKLSAKGKSTLFAAFDTCVKSATLADSLAKSFAQGSDGLSDATSTCLAGKIVAKYPKAGELMRTFTSDSGQLQTLITPLVTDCIPKDEIRQQLISGMSGSGLTDAQTGCVADKILEKIPVSEFAKIGSGDIPADVQQEITDAATACASGG